MNRVLINLEALHHNLSVIDSWMQKHESSWTLVTKVLCGHQDTMAALDKFGIRSVGESRLENLEQMKSVAQNMETWYLRVPTLSSIEDVIELSDVSLNTEVEVIEALNDQAAKQGKNHRVVIMIELGDLREGLLPGSLVKFYENVFELSNIEVIGIGSNMGCLAGVVPSVDQFMQLVLYRELLELKFGQKLPVISAGSSAVLPLVLDGTLPRPINHFRIGESVFLGSDLISGGILPGLRNDAIILEAEVAELKEKSLVPPVETSSVAPFQHDYENNLEPGQRGYRAIVSIGNLDTDVAGLTPENDEHHIAGASSDVTVVNIGEESKGINVGDVLRFKLSYSKGLLIE